MLYIFKTKNMYTDSVLPSLYMTVEKKKFPCNDHGVKIWGFSKLGRTDSHKISGQFHS